MADRRTFLKSLAGITAGLSISNADICKLAGKRQAWEKFYQKENWVEPVNM